MKLRDEARIKDKVEFHIETRHVTYLIVWSVVFSGIIFYTGIVVGKRSNPLPAPAPAPIHGAAKKVEAPEDKLVRSIPLLPAISVHPDQEEMADVVLNAMARLRLETLRKAEREDKLLEAELQEELFPQKPESERARPSAPEDVLKPSAGIGVKGHQAAKRLGQVPPMPVAEPEPASAPALVPVPAVEDPAANEPAAEAAAQADFPVVGELPVKTGAAALFEAFVAQASRPTGASAGGAEPAVDAERNGAADNGAAGKGAAVNGVAGNDEPLPVEKARQQGGKAYAIQAKSFRDKAEADVFLEYLKQSLGAGNYAAFIMPVDLPNKGKWYRVRIGHFQSISEAQKFKDAFEKKEGMQTILVAL